MAKSKDGVNRSQAIRDVLKEKPDAKPSEVITILGAKGIKVATSLVYMVKSQMKRKKRRQKRDLAVATSKEMGLVNPVDLIVKVKKLAGETGGMKKLKQLVDLMAE